MHLLVAHVLAYANNIYAKPPRLNEGAIKHEAKVDDIKKNRQNEYANDFLLIMKLII